MFPKRQVLHLLIQHLMSGTFHVLEQEVNPGNIQRYVVYRSGFTCRLPVLVNFHHQISQLQESHGFAIVRVNCLPDRFKTEFLCLQYVSQTMTKAARI